MRANAGIFLIGLLLIMGTAVSAADPFIISKVSSSNEYPVANGVEQAVITVAVQNTTSLAYVSGATVTFSVDPALGALNPAIVITDAYGYAKTTFTVKTKSGIAHINVSASKDTLSNANTVNIDQSVDHDSPYTYLPDYYQEGVVGTVVPFSATITDRWGNPIDNVIKPENHPVTLTVYGPAPDDCGFAESGFDHTVTTNLDASGRLLVNVLLTSKPGANNIHVYPFGSISHQWEWINAVTEGIPFSITAEFFPPGDPPTQIVNEDIIITYTMVDKFGNPAGNQQITVTSDGLGGPWIYTTNYEGKAFATYSQPIAGTYLVTAIPAGNTTLSAAGTVKFENAGASVFTIAANPQMMASLDANPEIFSNITVKVMDVMGNPVKGEIVTFSGPTDIDLNGAIPTSDPFISETSAITDVNGEATTTFTPGGFIGSSTPGYIPTATGTCLVTATWNGEEKDVLLTWKNYPYLSAVITVSKPVVFVNDTFDVNIKLNGDGWALKKNPIDVVLVMDRSGSMAWDLAGNSPPQSDTRMSIAKTAANSFIEKMDSSADRVGLVSYSYYYSVTTTSLQKPFGPVITAVNNMNAVGATGTRTALKAAIDSINTATPNLNPRTVKAIILMTDGNFNNDGTPLGIGNGFPNSDNDLGTNSIATWSGSVPDFTTYKYYPDLGGGTYNYGSVQVPDGDYGGSPYYQTRTVEYYTNADTTSQNMALYAKNNNIRIYTISFASTLDADVYDVLETLATETGGFYRDAPDAATLTNIYADIANDLLDEASVDTTAVMDFSTMQVNEEIVPGIDILEYVPDPPTLPHADPGSTWIHKYNKSHGDSLNTIINQMPEWLATQTLSFNDIGTIHINETWETTFRFRLLETGNINLFDQKSSIQFTDPMNTGVNQLFLPNVSVIGQPNWTGIFATQTIVIEDLQSAATGEITDFLPVRWETIYTGDATVTEQLYYSIDNGPWVKFGEKTGIGEGQTSGSAELNIKSLPPGGYRVKVYATAPDAPDCEAIMQVPVTVGGAGKYFIKLE